MPLVASRLQQNIESLTHSKVQAKYPNAIKTSYLTQYAKGVATGFVSTIQGRQGTINGANNVGGVGQGILGIMPETLSGDISSNCAQAFGQLGPATNIMADALAEAIVAELAQASVIGQQGGIAQLFFGWSGSEMGSAMLRATGFATTDQNTKFFNAIGEAITKQIQLFGASVIPVVVPGGGQPLATIT